MQLRRVLFALLSAACFAACSGDDKPGRDSDGGELTDGGSGPGNIEDAGLEMDAQGGADAARGDAGMAPADASSPTSDASHELDADIPADASSDAGDASQVLDADIPADASPEASVPCAQPTLQQTGSLVAGSPSAVSFATDLGEPVSFALTQGELPPGTTLAASGELTGSPSESGSFTFDLILSWAASCSVTRTATLEVGCPTQSVVPEALGLWEVGQASDFDLTHVGAMGSSTFSLVSGTWPTGVSMSSDGHVTGAGAGIGHGDLMVRAEDAANCTATRTYTYRVCDLLNSPIPSHWTLSNYYTGGQVGSDGWINGNNIYRDREKAMRFVGAPSGQIHGVNLAFGQASTTDATLVVPVRIYGDAGDAPGSVLGTANLTMEQIVSNVSEGVYTEVTFSPPVSVPASGVFYVSVDLTNLRWDATNHDVLSIVSNSNGQTVPSEIWERQTNDQWYRYGSAESWNLDASLFVHPRICD